MKVRIPCATCGGSGFSGWGCGYDAVCDDCAGCPVREEELEELLEILRDLKKIDDPKYDIKAQSAWIYEVACAALRELETIEIRAKHAQLAKQAKEKDGSDV